MSSHLRRDSRCDPPTAGMGRTPRAMAYVACCADVLPGSPADWQRHRLGSNVGCYPGCCTSGRATIGQFRRLWEPHSIPFTSRRSCGTGFLWAGRIEGYWCHSIAQCIFCCKGAYFFRIAVMALGTAPETGGAQPTAGGPRHPEPRHCTPGAAGLPDLPGATRLRILPNDSCARQPARADQGP